MTFKPGDDVIVEFDGHEHHGEIVKTIAHGYVMATIEIDPLVDYGSITPRLSPYQTVAVKTSRVRPRD